MGFKAKIIYSDGDYELEDLFDTEEEAYEAAQYDVSCYHLGGEILEMMGGEEGEIGYDDPEIEVWEE